MVCGYLVIVMSAGLFQMTIKCTILLTVTIISGQNPKVLSLLNSINICNVLNSVKLWLQCEIESNKQNSARQTALVQSLRDRIREAEDDAVEKDNFANRSDVTISSLRKELQTQQDRLQQVESSLKHHITAEEEAASRAAKWESKVSVAKFGLFVSIIGSFTL